MPKLNKDFPAQLSISTTDESKICLIAIGYMTGNGGEYATTSRNFLDQGIRDYLAKLDPKERARWEEILANVRIQYTRRLPGENQKTPATL